MTERSYQRRFQEILGRVSQPARLIGSEIGAGPGFASLSVEVDAAAGRIQSKRPPSDTRLRVVVGFPDTYEIGISNQAVQILYHLARCASGVAVERAYLPWVDVLAEMRKDGVPLLTLETWTPVAETDLVALTLQHEFSYTNVLEMLDLAGLPVRADARAEGMPLILGGGPAVADFLPVAPFFDAIAVGDGEELFPEMLAVLTEAKRQALSRQDTLRRLAGLEGVFVPGLSRKVRRRVLGRLEGAPFPTQCLVPLTAGVHDRAWVEIMRGCTRGCRFCQAGMWYRPVRERAASEVMAMAGAQLDASGHQELALASLSTTDYSALEGLLGRLVQERPEVRLSLPSLRVDSAAVRLAHLASPTGPSLTLAPEAGSQRMRDLINKNVSDADIMAAAEEAFRGGCTTLKLYFIIGFPRETDEDVIAIADLCLRLRDAGRKLLGPKASRVQLNISVNNFVPKALTPFQWAGMADRATLRSRQELLRARLRKPGLRLALHDVGKSYLEAALARGGSEYADVIEGAWRRGAFFDSWTERFRRDAWDDAFAAAGLDMETEATRALPRDTVLPWEVIEGTVDRGFLWTEWERAAGGEMTPDCRWDACSDCGACGPGQRPDLTAGGAPPAPAARPPARPEQVAHPAAERAATAGFTYLLTFAVKDRTRFVGHLDKTEIFRRAVRRAGATLALSAGMRPKALLTLALPLAVGLEADVELCEFTLAEPAAADLLARLAASLPPGLEPRSLDTYDERRAVAARVTGAYYEVEVETADLADPTALFEAVSRFRSAPSLVVEERRADKVRSLDVKEYVAAVDARALADGCYAVSFRVAVTPHGSARPERVLEALEVLGAPRLNMVRGRRTRIELS